MEISNPALLALLKHPAFGALLFTLLCLWPLAVVFRRSGRSPWWALLFAANAALPFVGYIMAGVAFLCTKPRKTTA